MSRSTSPVFTFSYRTLLLFSLITSLTFVEMEDSYATKVKKKSAKIIAPKNAKRSSVSTLPNTLLNGLGAPSATLGINGDFYIDTLTMNIYGPKKKNAWPLPKSLVGPQGIPGAPGVAGKQGNNGKDGRDGNNGKDGERGVAGSSSGGSGAAGPAGSIGPVGPAGLVGPAGPAGTAGVAGAQGLPGSSGSNGAPGAQGAQGVQGEIGPRGLQGETGAAGAAGAQGVQGIAGPVSIQLANLVFTGVLSGTEGTSRNFNDFGSLVAGKKYLLSAYIYTKSDVTTDPPLSATVSAVGASVTPTTRFSTTNGFTYRGAIAAEEWGLAITSTIDGESLVGSNYQLRIGIACGTNTTQLNGELVLYGYYLLQEVSSIN